jgi:hypothetical protein
MVASPTIVKKLLPWVLLCKGPRTSSKVADKGKSYIVGELCPQRIDNENHQPRAHLHHAMPVQEQLPQVPILPTRYPDLEAQYLFR